MESGNKEQMIKSSKHKSLTYNVLGKEVTFVFLVLRTVINRFKTKVTFGTKFP